MWLETESDDGLRVSVGVPRAVCLNPGGGLGPSTGTCVGKEVV